MAEGTTLANAYVQILPTTKGIKGNLEKELGGVGEPAGRSAGKKFSSALKRTALAGVAAIGVGLGKSLLEGANLEQSIGGVETLFGKSADKVIANADKAWKTAGLSANAYMEQATSFSASLLQSLGNDTKKAAKYADMAIIDMSDNANKMGTDIELIQNAYQGFAKQNYTMLDNLKLGYGGTKTEMERLLKDAGKISGQKYDIGNLSDVYEAIHVIQGELDITGTTSKEAASTLSGSFASMKSSMSNFLGDLALGRNVEQSMSDLVEASTTFLFNNLVPAVGTIFKSLPTAITTFIRQGLPQIRTAGQDLFNSIVSGLGDMDILSKIMPMLSGLSGKLLQASGGLVDAGMGLLQKLATGIAKGLPAVIQYAPQIIGNLADVINKNAPKLLIGGAKILLTLGKGILSAIPVFIQNIPQIFQAFLKVWEAINWMNLGRLALTGIKNGFASMAELIGPKVKEGFVKVKDFILKPSNEAAKRVGSIVAAIKNKFNFGSVVSKVTGTFGRIRNAITSPITKARDKVKGIIDKIKGLFPLKVGKIMSGLKVPHIKVSGGKAPFGIAGKGSVPKISVAWNKKAMENPYLFSDATLFGAGEAGDEVLYGKQNLLNDIAAAVRSAGGSGGTLQLVINLDGRTIGQVATEYQNGQTIMFGTNPVLV